MSEPATLNQELVDALFARGEAETEVAVRPFSFSRPTGLSKRAELLLEPVQERMVSGLERFLSSQMRQAAEVTLQSLERVPFGALTQSLGSPAATFLLGNDARAVVDWGVNLSLACVDRLLGGKGQDIGSRALTPIESGIMTWLMGRALPVIQEAWSDLRPFPGQNMVFEAQPVRMRAVAEETAYLAAIFEVRFPEVTGMLTVGYPLAALEDLLEAEDEPKEKPDARELFDSELQHTRVTVTASLPSVLLTMKALKALTPGQVLDTKHPVDAPVEVRVNGNLLFQGVLGESGGRLGIRIARTAETPPASRMDYTKRGSVQ